MKLTVPSTTLYTSFFLVQAIKAGLVVSPEAQADVDKYLEHLNSKRLNKPVLHDRSLEIISQASLGAKNYDEFKKACNSHERFATASLRDGLQAVTQIVEAGKRIRFAVCELLHFPAEVFVISLTSDQPQLTTMNVHELRQHDGWLVRSRS